MNYEWCTGLWIQWTLVIINFGYKGANHVPKAVSDYNLLPDFIGDFNYVHSQALQPPSRSRTGSAHCEVIFCSYCADWPFDPCMASARISKMHTHESRSERALRSQVVNMRLSRRITIPNSIFCVCFKSLIWKSFAFTKGKSGFQIRKGSESRSEMAFGTWFAPFEQALYMPTRYSVVSKLVTNG